MGAAFFYHLTQRPLEATLPVLLEKSLAAGWRVAVRGVDRDRMEWLDRTLWQGPDDGFLPHGLAGGRHRGITTCAPAIRPPSGRGRGGTRCMWRRSLLRPPHRGWREAQGPWM